MTTSSVRCLAWVLVFGASAGLADIRTSSSYAVPAEAFDSGGLRNSSPSYNAAGSIGLISGSQSSAAYSTDIGLFPQLGSQALFPPFISTSAVTGITGTLASLNGVVNPNGDTTTAQFQYGTTVGYGTNVSVTLSPDNGTTAQNVSANITGLTPGTLYHYRLSATNNAGTSDTSDATFTTLSNNANLSNLVLSSGTLSPAFASGTVSYTAGVAFATASLTVTPTTADANASITVNGNAVTSGGTSGAISLSVGSNTITTVVTAQDGTPKTYTITVTRAAPVPGTLDTSFGTNGIVTTPIGSGDESGHGVAVQSDGKIVVAGESHNGSSNDFAVARYTATGVLDPGFGTGGKVTTSLSPANDQGYGVGVQADGKIVVAGTVYNGTARDFALVRYTTTGVLDTSFGTGGMVLTDFTGYDESYSMAIQPDGKIVLAGSSDGASTNFALARYTTTGALDTSFDTDGKVITDMGGLYEIVLGMTLQSDGKIVVSGSVWNGSNYDLAVARYTTTGALDTSFDTDGKVITPIGPGHDYGYSVAVQGDGKIVVGGMTYNGSNYDFALVRYTSAGALDATFGTGGKVTTAIGSGEDQGASLVLQSDGKIVLVGSSSNGANNDFAVVRYNTNGTLDTSFYGTGMVTTPIGPGNDGARAVALQADGRIVAAGESFNGSNNDFALVRCLGDLRPVVGLAAATGITATTATLNGTVNPNESVTAAQFDFGLTTAYGSSASVTLTPNDGSSPQNVSANLTGLTRGTLYHYRLTATNSAGTSNTSDGTFFTTGPGSLDVTFGTNGIVTAPIGSSSDYGLAVAVQSDGKTVVAGFTDVPPTNDFAVARFNADGTPDTTFGTGGKVTTDFAGHSDYGRAVAIQSDGKIVVAGQSYNAAGTVRSFAVVRYNTNGSLDDGSVNDSTPGDNFDGDGKAIIPSMGTGIDNGYAVVIQPDGKIVVAGTTLNVSHHNFALVRLNTDGTLDSSFGTGGKATPLDFAGSDDLGLAVALQSDGRMVVAGHAHNGTNYDIAAARFLSNGTLDTTFNGTGKVTTPVGTAGEGAFAVVVQSDDRIVLGGWSTNGSGVNDFCLVRYHTGGALDGSFGTGGKVIASMSTGNDTAYGLALQRDGKLILAGRADNGSNNDFAVARFNSDGSPDLSFNGTGKATTPIGSADDQGQAVALRSDGAIIVAGFAWNGSNYDFALVRYLGGPYPPVVQTLAATNVLPFTATLNGTANPNGLAATAWFEYGTTISYGTSTTTQNIGSGLSAANVTANLTGLTANTLYHAHLIAQNGDAITYGDDITFTTPLAVPEIRVFAGADDTAPELTDGQVTAVDFGSTPLGTPVTRSFTVKNVGNINLQVTGITLPAVYEYVGTAFPYNMGPNSTVTFQVRFLANTIKGVFGSAFSLDNNDGNESPFDLSLTAQAKIGGNPSALDVSFDGDGLVQTVVPFGSPTSFVPVAAALQSDDRIVVAGNYFSGNQFRLARHLPDGNLDNTFDGDGYALASIGEACEAHAVAIQSTGKIVVAGRAFVSGTPGFAFARFNTNGSLDTTFGTNGVTTFTHGDFYDAEIRGIAIQADDKIVGCGRVDDGIQFDLAVVRLTAQGTPDPTFGGDGIATVNVGGADSYDGGHAVAIAPDGMIVVTGESAEIGEDQRLCVVRLSTSGSLDNSFNGNGRASHFIDGIQSWGNAVTVLPDLSVIAAGYTYSDASPDENMALIKLTSSGALDVSFDGDGKRRLPFLSDGMGAIGVIVQPNGKIIVGGDASRDFLIARLLSNGAFDSSFSSGGYNTATFASATAVYPVSLLPQRDGKHIVVGSLSHTATPIPNVTYYVAMARFGADLSAVVATITATNSDATTVTLNGTVNPNGVITSAWFEYGTTTSYGQTTTSQPQGYGTSATPVTANLTGLTPGTLYHYRIVAQNGETTAYGADLTFTTLTLQQGWRQQYFGITTNTGNAADSFDYDKDGLVNLLEWACNLNPTTASVLPITTVRNGAFFEFTYTRSVAALNAGAAFIVEWSDDLPGINWSSTGVTEQIFSDNGTVQQVKALVPVGSQGRRFVHLKVTGL